MKRYEPIVAIDGPVGAGKSTVARAVAQSLGYIHVDTGAMYRAVALAVLERGVAPDDEQAVADSVDAVDVTIVPSAGGQRTLLDGVDVSERIRTPEVTKAVSAVSALKPVRDRMTGMQREAGKMGGVVMEGRDIATVVFPDAELKIYLDADVEVRAKRRQKDYADTGTDVSLDELIKDIRERDRANSERAIAPLKKAADAIVIDTTGMAFDEVVAAIADMAREKHAEMRPPSIRNRMSYRIVKLLIRLFFKIVYRIEAHGLHNIPERGGVIIASNHASALDPPAVGCMLSRESLYFAKKELLKIPVLGPVISHFNALPVDRFGFNATQVTSLIDRIRNGWCVVLFPEGTRTKDGNFREPKSGVGLIAVKADVPVVPCWIEGSYKARPFRSKLRIHYLPAFHPSEIECEDKKEKYLLVSKRIMHYIDNLYTTRMAQRKGSNPV